MNADAGVGQKETTGNRGTICLSFRADKDLHQNNLADDPAGAQTSCGVEHCPQQGRRGNLAFHQQLGLAGADQGNCLACRILTFNQGEPL